MYIPCGLLSSPFTDEYSTSAMLVPVRSLKRFLICLPFLLEL
jgi:hypothetical protein